MANELQEQLEILMDESEQDDIKDFSFELINAVWSEFCDVDPEDIELEMVKAYAQETEQSLEIFNPTLELDITYLERLMKILETYIKKHE